MELPLVTVVTVTRNRGNLIGRCISSIINQTYKNIEHIIVDGASEDNTSDVVSSFNDSRVKYFKRDAEHAGQLECYDFAFENSKGEYLCFLDDDDEYLPTKIEKQVELLQTLSKDYGMVYCWMTYYDSVSGKEIRIHNPQVKGCVAEDVVEKPVVSGTPTFLFKKSTFLEMGGFVKPSECGVSSDWATAARYCQKWKVDFVPESLIKVYVNHGAVRMSETQKYYEDSERKNIVFHQYFLSTYSDIFNRYPQKAWLHYMGLTYSYYRLHEFGKGNKYYWKLLHAKLSFDTLFLPFKVLIINIIRK